MNDHWRRILEEIPKHAQNHETLKDYCHNNMDEEELREIRECVIRRINPILVAEARADVPPWGDEIYDQPDILIDCIRIYLANHGIDI